MSEWSQAYRRVSRTRRSYQLVDVFWNCQHTTISVVAIQYQWIALQCTSVPTLHSDKPATDQLGPLAQLEFSRTKDRQRNYDLTVSRPRGSLTPQKTAAWTASTRHSCWMTCRHPPLATQSSPKSHGEEPSNTQTVCAPRRSLIEQNN